MTGMLRYFGYLVVATSVVACGDNITQGGSPACDADTRIDCLCPETGLQGRLSCDDGVLGACVCPEPEGGDKCSADIQCDDGAFCNGIERCLPDAEDANARGCVTGMLKPFCVDELDCTVDRCSNELNRCVHEAPDADGDGHPDASCLDADGLPLGDDCDDDDPLRFPGNFEVCDDDNRDEDCNAETFGKRDEDGDGAIDARCCNGDNCGDDCDDSLLSRRPLQPEFCDDVDNDCDGEVDEEAAAVPWYSDTDGDGFGGDGADVEMSCIPIPGKSLVDTDCEDSNSQRHPGQLEICDLIDNNCDGAADEGMGCGMPTGYPVGGGGMMTGSGGMMSTGGMMGSGGMMSTGGMMGSGGMMTGGMMGTGGMVEPRDLLECPTRDVTGATQVSGNISDIQTWSGVVHLTGNVRLSGAAQLTIEPGTVVLADPGVTFTAGYAGSATRLTAVGTEDEPIYFCGKADYTGYWDGVAIDPTTDPVSALSWVLISDAGNAAAGAGLRIKAPVKLTEVHVRNSAVAGIEASDFGVGSSRVYSTDNGGAAMEVSGDRAIDRLPGDSVWTGNGEDAIVIKQNNWNSSVTVRDPDVPYVIEQDFDLRGDTTVIEIEPGVVFEVETDVDFDIGYAGATLTIRAEGTEQAPIVFRRHQADYAWSGMLVQAQVRSSSFLRHVRIEGAGAGDYSALETRAAIELQDVTIVDAEGVGMLVNNAGLRPTSTRITVEGTSGTPIVAHADALTKLGDAVTLTGNTYDWIEVQQSTRITSSGTIRDFGDGYYLPFGLSTGTGAPEVTIEPGVEFTMGISAQFLLGYAGNPTTLIAVGTSAEPIVFRPEVAGSGNEWEGIHLAQPASAGSKLQHVHIFGGGSSGYGNLRLNMNTALPPANLTDCVFEDSAAYGIHRNNAAAANDYGGNNNSFDNNALGDIHVP